MGHLPEQVPFCLLLHCRRAVMELIAQKLLGKCFLSSKIKSGTIRTTEKGGVKPEAQEDGNPEKGWESVCSRKAERVGGMKRPDMTKSQSCFSLARCLEGL